MYRQAFLKYRFVKIRELTNMWAVSVQLAFTHYVIG
jgi:hypothetical protein